MLLVAIAAVEAAVEAAVGVIKRFFGGNLDFPKIE